MDVESRKLGDGNYIYITVVNLADEGALDKFVQMSVSGNITNVVLIYIVML